MYIVTYIELKKQTVLIRYLGTKQNVTHNYAKPKELTDYESRGGTSDFRLPTSDFKLQTSDFRLQTSDFRLLVLAKKTYREHCYEDLVTVILKRRSW
ncbi:hypothetical protein P5673_011139 [Acropora cervicornis]|uniref:Uncharacterized protein n=1 Tax=Acropora cervicornis TaxID=6130 RepID=A0AAD9QQ07_ACRCE|nr:hypothetical protein P5673_011139 [Acropora cervicornis]